MRAPTATPGAPPPSADAVAAGAAPYTPAMLRVYDAAVLGASNRLLWRCPTSRLLALYDAHAGPRHLDAGVGSGYFLDHCRFGGARPQITLLDLSPAALEHTARRIARHAPRTVRASVLDDLPPELEPGAFDSVGATYLLHCVPGDMALKAAALGRLGGLLGPGGTLFGATILARGVSRTPASRAVSALYNRRRIFANAGDDRAGLERGLAEHFAAHELRVQGCVALFTAREPRRASAPGDAA